MQLARQYFPSALFTYRKQYIHVRPILCQQGRRFSDCEWMSGPADMNRAAAKILNEQQRRANNGLSTRLQAGRKANCSQCEISNILTLRLLMSYIYGAPSKARNANVVYIWTYVWQH